MQKVLIALIHNEEQSRLEYLNNELELIKLMLIRWGYFPRIIKVGGGGASNRESYSKYAIVRRMLNNEIYAIKNLDFGQVSRFAHLCRQIKQLVFLMIQYYKPFNAKRLNQRFNKIRIEDEVSRKHLSVMSEFLKAEEDYLVVFESDSIISNREALCLEIRELIDRPDTKKITLFNSHFSFEELNISPEVARLVWSDHISNLKYEVPFLATNTLCSYGMSKVFASVLMAQFEKKNKFPLPPADWMFDQAFKEITIFMNGVTRDFKTVFYYPPLVENGSLKGIYTSGIQGG